MKSKKFVIEVEEVKGVCEYNYKKGDKFYAKGLGTPEPSLCGGAYMVIFPMMTALNLGARFYFEKNPLSKTKLACPDNGYVIFKVTLLEQ